MLTWLEVYFLAKSGRKSEVFKQKMAFPDFRQQELCPAYLDDLKIEKQNEAIKKLT